MADAPRGIDGQVRPSEGKLVFGGRYRVVQMLRLGPGAETLLAIDMARGDRVVIKTVSAEGVSPCG
ncbi:MAG TPA: hypothetical protein VGZ22_06970, partial [Isosphaeraceae bacterium]|nr:hypothetical protein [Isosphaeraceae bacterium]